MAHTQVHKFESDSTNYIALEYDLSTERPDLNTLKLNFTNIKLVQPSKYTNDEGEEVDNQTTFSFWLGIWPKVVLKNGSTPVYTHEVQVIGEEKNYMTDVGKRPVISNRDKALIVKPYIQNHTWTSYNSDAYADNDEDTSFELKLDLSDLTEPEKKSIDTADLYFQCYSFHAYLNSTTAWGGCPCNDHSEKVKNIPADFSTPITAGSVSIVDNGNNTITVSGTNGAKGINNAIAASSLEVKLGSTVLSSSRANNDLIEADTATTKASQDTFSYTYTITASGTITAELTNTGNKGDTVTASDTEDVKFYTPPKWKNAAKLTFDSGDEGQYNDRPRLKKPLKWTWSGAEAGNTEDHNVIRGYQIYICNGGGGTDKAVGLYPYRGKFTLNSGNTSPGAKVFETSTNNSAGAYDYVINRGTTNNTLVTDGSGNISFTPKDLGFASKNICYCRVRPFSYWGNRVATIELDSDGNKADYTQYAKNYGPWLIGICTADGGDNTATYIKGTQCILSNGAVVWVRVDTNGDDIPDTWKEGTVYVYHNGEWKEAEGVYVRDGSKWKEST